MKVLKNNYEQNCLKEEIKEVKPYPRKFICENCGSELEYEKQDLRVGEYGVVFIDCPLCGCENIGGDNEDDVTLTKDNIEFPTHFAHISKETGAVDCCNDYEIKKYIKQAIQYFRENKNEYNWYVCTGNININVYRYEGDESYWVVVTNNYYDTYIQFEPEDY